MAARHDEGRCRGRRRRTVEQRYLTVIHARGYSVHTLRGYRETIADLCAFAHTGAAGVSQEDVEEWMSHLRQVRGNSPRTVAQKLVPVRGICRWMVEEGIRADDPTARLRSPRPPRTVPRPAPEAAVSALLCEKDPNIRMAAALGAYAGLRRAEIAGLRWSDLTPEGIWVSVGAKGGHRRVVGMHEELRRVLMAHPQSGDTVLAQPDGRPYAPDSLSNLVRPAMRRAGLGARQSLHTLRHRFATEAVDGGAHMLALGSVMGHVSVETTQGYAAVSEKRRREVITAIRPAG